MFFSIKILLFFYSSSFDALIFISLWYTWEKSCMDWEKKIKKVKWEFFIGFLFLMELSIRIVAFYCLPYFSNWRSYFLSVTFYIMYIHYYVSYFLFFLFLCIMPLFFSPLLCLPLYISIVFNLTSIYWFFSPSFII